MDPKQINLLIYPVCIACFYQRSENQGGRAFVMLISANALCLSRAYQRETNCDITLFAHVFNRYIIWTNKISIVAVVFLYLKFCLYLYKRRLPCRSFYGAGGVCGGWNSLPQSISVVATSSVLCANSCLHALLQCSSISLFCASSLNVSDLTLLTWNVMLNHRLCLCRIYINTYITEIPYMWLNC